MRNLSLRQAKYLTHEHVEKNRHDLEVCTACGKGEGDLFKYTCPEFDPAA